MARNDRRQDRERGAPGRPEGSARLFVAVPLDRRAREAIARATTEILVRSDIRATPANRMHLTLRFLGDTPESRIPPISGAIAAAVARLAPFSLRLRGAGAFPDPRRPRVVWVGVEPAPALISLHGAIEAALEGVGVERDSRPFRPHVTVGRVRGAGSATAMTAEIQRVRLDIASGVDGVVLVRSHVGPGGAHHRELGRYPLANVGGGGT